jgi:hypothetical protein
MKQTAAWAANGAGAACRVAIHDMAADPYHHQSRHLLNRAPELAQKRSVVVITSLWQVELTGSSLQQDKQGKNSEKEEHAAGKGWQHVGAGQQPYRAGQQPSVVQTPAHDQGRVILAGAASKSQARLQRNSPEAHLLCDLGGEAVALPGEHDVGGNGGGLAAQSPQERLLAIVVHLQEHT